MKDMTYYANRELSWLSFNERVLEEAKDEKNPLCERLTFFSIFQTNLDEFFRVRVGSLEDQLLLVEKEIRDNKTNMTCQEQIDAILAQVRKLNREKNHAYQEMMDQLSEENIALVDFSKLSNEESGYLESYFKSEVMPLISPMIIGKKQPFPFLKNKEIYAVVVLETKSGKEKIGIVPCSSGVFERLVTIPFKKENHMLSEELILHFVPMIFSNYTIKAKTLIRITRNADIDEDSIYDEDLDYREQMEELVKRRRKLNPVRLELSRDLDPEVVELLCEYLELDKGRVFKSETPLDFSFLFHFQDDLRQKQELFFEKRVPQMPACIDAGRDVIPQVLEEDKLLSYPYESIKPFLRMLAEASRDPAVVSIKMTLYRVARHSKVVETLIEAAENGKDVYVLVELRARFDEENNIEWSRRLEEAGCHVIYGLEGYKVHSKLCLITRKSQGQIEYITQIGTGNYNEKTARLYTDLMLLTANEQIGAEASQVFNSLYMGEIVERTQNLLVAPRCLQNHILIMIDEQIALAKEGKPAYIGLKLNSLTDKKIMDKLVEASQAGVKIDMVIRGICCLVAGVKGYTENIRVISIVGRFLEHSRIYIFGCGESEKIYIASADFMTRNTLRRVEVAVPVLSPTLKLRLREMFITMLSDNCKARIQKKDGTYEHISTGDTPLNAQEFFYAQAYEAAEEHRE